MSQTSQLSQELQELEAAAWEAATRLEFCLRAISDLHWGESGDVPQFRATKATLWRLQEIEVLLGGPIAEIESSAA
ncbi:MAG: hypothetical protein ACO3S8_05500 [Aquiluna sp.]